MRRDLDGSELNFYLSNAPWRTRLLCALLPQRAWTAADPCRWLAETQKRNQHAKRSHAKRRLLMQRKPSL